MPECSLFYRGQAGCMPECSLFCLGQAGWTEGSKLHVLCSVVSSIACCLCAAPFAQCTPPLLLSPSPPSTSPHKSMLLRLLAASPTAHWQADLMHIRSSTPAFVLHPPRALLQHYFARGSNQDSDDGSVLGAVRRVRSAAASSPLLVRRLTRAHRHSEPWTANASRADLNQDASPSQAD